MALASFFLLKFFVYIQNNHTTTNNHKKLSVGVRYKTVLGEIQVVSSKFGKIIDRHK